MTEKLRTAIYCRDTENTDIEYQLGLAMAFVNGCPEYELKKIFIDRENHSIRKTLDGSIRDIDVVIVVDAGKDAGRCTAFAEETGIDIVSADYSYNSASDIERLKKGIAKECKWAKKLAQQIADQKSSISEAADKEAEIIRQVPYGYVKTEDGLAIDPEAAPYIRQMFELAANGLSNKEIAEKLNEQAGDPNAWKPTTVGTRLANIMYYGDYPINKEKRGADRIRHEGDVKIIPNHHKAIIDPCPVR